MASSLFQKQMRNLTAGEKTQIKNLLGMVKNAGNPQQALLGMMGENVNKLLGGKNPKDAFYSKCEELGVNPDDILSMLK